MELRRTQDVITEAAQGVLSKPGNGYAGVVHVEGKKIKRLGKPTAL